MKAEIDISEEQFAALQRSHIAAFPDEATRPSLAEFITAGAQAKLNEHVQAWRQRDLDEALAAVRRKAAQITPADLYEVRQIAAKYDPPASPEPEPENAPE